ERIRECSEGRRHAPQERDREQRGDEEHHGVGNGNTNAVGALAARDALRSRGAHRGLALQRKLLGRRERRYFPAAHQATSGLPNRSRWTSVTTKMNTNRTTPIAAACPKWMLRIAVL